MIAPSHLFDRVRATLGAPDALYAVAAMFANRGAHARAFPLFVEAAQSGFHPAQYRLGRCYKMGLGVPISLGEALRWFRRAADAGEAAAQTQLAELLLLGVSDHPPSGLFDAPGVTNDYDRAAHWCREAVAGGSSEAKALLAFILTDGPEERRDPAAGEALYREAAEAGWSRGQLGLALALLRDGTPEGSAEALTLLREAASGGIAIAHHLLGIMTESGAAGDVDLPAAAAHYRTAAECGHIGAQVRYGFALLHGRGVVQDTFNAETWLRRAGLAGDAQAAAVVGYLYASDGELPPNHAEAAMWLRRAAEAGHAAAARTLGRFLLIGQGLPSDVTEAVKWLRKSADGGDEAARGDLVRLMLTRQLDPDNEQAVIEMLRAAAEAHDPEAEFDLGLCLAQGIGVSQDGQAALAWIHRSAEGGYPRATQMMANLATEAEPAM
jgi:TPR repeat protein